jgi:hypothetical protein
MADRELDDLAKYLLHVATIDDMETLNHKVGAKFHHRFTIVSLDNQFVRTGNELSVHCLRIDCSHVRTLQRSSSVMASVFNSVA